MHKCATDECERRTLDKREHCTLCREQEIPEDISHLLPADHEEDKQATLTDGGAQ